MDVNNIEARISEVQIDTNIPIKLIFLMNAMPIEKLIKEDEKARYWQGGAQEVGEKLLELDQEWVA